MRVSHIFLRSIDFNGADKTYCMKLRCLNREKGKIRQNPVKPSAILRERGKHSRRRLCVRKMQIPTIVRKTGTISGECRVYIEDYAYTYLNEMKEREGIFPVRAALYGHACSKNQKQFYFIYGAADVIEELADGRNEEEIRKKYFAGYELLGYVNLYPQEKSHTDKQEGCYIFYETNEAMQDYLVSCYERKKQRPEHITKTEKEEKTQEGKSSFWMKFLQKLIYGFLILILAVAVITIDDYNKMHEFTEIAAKAIDAAEVKP